MEEINMRAQHISVRHRVAAAIFGLTVGFGLAPWFSAAAAEIGRFPVTNSVGRDVPPGTGRVEVAHTYRSAISADVGPGIDFGLGWNPMYWKVGDDSYRDQAFTPQASFFYSMGRHFDLRLTGRYYQMKDNDFDLKAGRLGVGPRGWLGLGDDLFGYAGFLFNYYYFYSEEGSNQQGTIGLSGEVGLAYLLSDYVSILLGIQAETTVANAKMDIKDKTTDQKETKNLSMYGMGLNLAVMITF
jgi:hypothetical protein